MTQYPTIMVNLEKTCCPKAKQSYDRITRKFVSPGGKVNLDYDIAAVLDRERWSSFDEYVHCLRSVHKGSASRHARKSEKAGFTAKVFPWRLHVPDACEINHSKPVRCGRPMRPAYCTPVEQMGGYPDSRKPPTLEIDCPRHHFVPWGVFKPVAGYRQGDIETGEKLLAYIKFKRMGDMALYTQILGHGDYLKYGIMYFLHFAIMRWLLDTVDPLHEGIKTIAYAQFFSGNHGLRQWKKKVMFEPARLISYEG